MAQCMHLDIRGRRCWLEAAEGLPFCPGHSQEGSTPLPPGVDRQRLAFRLAALILLVIFLVPLVMQGYRLLKSLLN